MERDQSASASEIETIFLWKTTKLRYDDLALKLQRSTFYVRNCISKYRKLVKKQTKYWKFEGARSSRVVNDLMIDEIDQYCWKNKNKPLTIQKIKEEVWKDNKNSDPPSNSTIAKILKTKLRMSYRTLATRHP